jgi:hypothetical protein
MAPRTIIHAGIGFAYVWAMVWMVSAGYAYGMPVGSRVCIAVFGTLLSVIHAVVQYEIADSLGD